MTSSEAVLNAARIVVIKIGSVLIRERDADNVRHAWFASLAQDVKALTDQGKRVIIVSSGGIALGRSALGIAHDMPPGQIPLPLKQAASAVGQHHMYAAYHQALGGEGLQSAQILLTMSETENRRMHLNARETLSTLLDKGIIPVINENDTVSTEEIRFGDNDRLAVRVAQMMEADLVVLLSTVDGLYTADPGKDRGASHIPVVEDITDDHITMAGDAAPGLSTGGMQSKIQAALSATQSGIPLIIAHGWDNHAINRVKTQKNTLFLSKKGQKNAKKTWIQAHLKPKGSVFVDLGATQALKSGKSLLPVGVQRVEGTFERGDVVSIHGPDDRKIGAGITAYSSKEAKMIMGQKSDWVHTLQGYARREELIHRNDMALFD